MPFESKISRIKRPRLDLPQTSYPASQVAALYGYPILANPSNQSVAFISLGGGYSPNDVLTYCRQYGFRVPSVKVVSIDGATNDYAGDPNGPDAENALDIQTIIGATHGMVDILMYIAPNREDSFAKAVKQVAIDNIACACSISWGSNESSSQSSMQMMDQAIKACIDAGIPVFAASGDDGSRDQGFGNNVDYPSSGPYTIGVGGTTIVPNPSGSPGSLAQRAWSYGGGGFSKVYAKPSWQNQNTQAARGIPDVAANSDPNSGYPITINGQWGNLGGTSAAAPLWAAGVALVVAKTGKRLSNLVQTIYAKSLLQDITTGTNGAFQAGVGWDACTGKGTPTVAFWSDLIDSLTPPVVLPPILPPVGVIMRIQFLMKILIGLLDGAILYITNSSDKADDAWLPALNWIKQILQSFAAGGAPPTPTQMAQAHSVLGIQVPINV